MRKIIGPVIQRNEFFAHPGNLLLVVRRKRELIGTENNLKFGLRILKVQTPFNFKQSP